MLKLELFKHVRHSSQNKNTEVYRRNSELKRAADKIKGTGVKPCVVDFNELWHFYYHY